MSEGWHVFRSLSPSCPCDLVVFKDLDNPIRVEVKTAYIRHGGDIFVSMEKHNVYDVIAAVTNDQVFYISARHMSGSTIIPMSKAVTKLADAINQP